MKPYNWFFIALMVISLYNPKKVSGAEPPQIEWYVTIGGSNDDAGFSVQQTPDGDYVIAGCRNNDVYLVKTDSTGNLLWDKTYGGVGGEDGYSLNKNQ